MARILKRLRGAWIVCLTLFDTELYRPVNSTERRDCYPYLAVLPVLVAPPSKAKKEAQFKATL